MEIVRIELVRILTWIETILILIARILVEIARIEIVRILLSDG